MWKAFIPLKLYVKSNDPILLITPIFIVPCIHIVVVINTFTPSSWNTGRTFLLN